MGLSSKEKAALKTTTAGGLPARLPLLYKVQGPASLYTKLFLSRRLWLLPLLLLRLLRLPRLLRCLGLLELGTAERLHHRPHLLLLLSAEAQLSAVQQPFVHAAAAGKGSAGWVRRGPAGRRCHGAQCPPRLRNARETSSRWPEAPQSPNHGESHPALTPQG